MKFKITLYPSEEGFAVSVPSLPGCWSQGATEEESLANIADAIREYLEAEIESAEGAPGGTGGLPTSVEGPGALVGKPPVPPNVRTDRGNRRMPVGVEEVSPRCESTRKID